MTGFEAKTSGRSKEERRMEVKEVGLVIVDGAR